MIMKMVRLVLVHRVVYSGDVSSLEHLVSSEGKNNCNGHLVHKSRNWNQTCSHSLFLKVLVSTVKTFQQSARLRQTYGEC